MKDSTSYYVITDSDDDATPNYYGFLRDDGAWYILRETTAVGNNTYRYAVGSSNYSTSWTGRAALTYDYYSEEF